MFSLVQLSVSTIAARTGSFTPAAAELHMAQPSVSEFVRRLEEEYGTRLFVRGGRRLVLTEAGESLFADPDPHLIARTPQRADRHAAAGQ